MAHSVSVTENLEARQDKKIKIKRFISNYSDNHTFEYKK